MIRSRRFPAASLLVLALAVPSLGLAQSNDFGGLVTRDYRIATDLTKSNLNTGDFTMPHHVRFFRPGTDASSESASGNYKRGVATLVGNVVIHDSGNAPETGGAYSGKGPATLSCDRLDVDSHARLYTATGHVRFNQGTSSGTAERAVLDRNSGMLHLEGAVHLSDGGTTLAASGLDYNLNTKDVNVSGSPAVITEPVGAAAAASPTVPRPSARRTPSPRKHS